MKLSLFISLPISSQGNSIYNILDLLESLDGLKTTRGEFEHGSSIYSKILMIIIKDAKSLMINFSKFHVKMKNLSEIWWICIKLKAFYNYNPCKTRKQSIETGPFLPRLIVPKVNSIIYIEHCQLPCSRRGFSPSTQLIEISFCNHFW